MIYIVVCGLYLHLMLAFAFVCVLLFYCLCFVEFGLMQVTIYWFGCV